MNNNHKKYEIFAQRVMIASSSQLFDSEMSLSFAGCGFLSFYYLGVGTCLRQYSLTKRAVYCGASSGAMAGLSMCLDMTIDQAVEQLGACAAKVGSKPFGIIHPSIDLNKIVYDGLIKLLPTDAYKRASGQLYISVTRVSDGKNVLISQYDSNEELIQALQCSCFMPFLSGLVVPKFRGTAYIDGALSNNAPKVDDKTITVSPWSGEFDICPINDTSFPLQVMFYNKLISLSPNNVYRMTYIAFPPDWEMQTMLCQQGYDDTLRFLQRNNKIVCDRCLFPSYGRNSTIIEELEEEEDFCERGQHLNNSVINCKDCYTKRQISTIDSLPEAVPKAIRETCLHFNSGYMKKFSRQTPIKLLLLLFMPFVLIFELMFAFIYGVLLTEWSPDIFRDVVKVSNIMITNGLFGRFPKTSEPLTRRL